MATFNLLRNSRVFFTTNVAAGTGVVAASGFTVANAQELQVLDGFSFSQSNNADTVTITEAGSTPNRGQRSFNTSLNPVEFSFSTYIRPKLNGTVKAEEASLWNALLSAVPIGETLVAPTTVTGTSYTAGTGVLILTGTGLPVLPIDKNYIITGVTGVGASQFNTAIYVTASSATGLTGTYTTAPTAAFVFGNFAAAKFASTAWNENAAIALDITPGIPAAYSTINSELSDVNKLVAFGMVITVDSTTYIIDNCVLDQAVVDFGLDGIATVAWTGKGTALRNLVTNVVYTTAADPVISGGLVGTIKGKNVTANFITNKLSTITLKSNIGGVAGTAYTLAITGGSLTIANGINFITPANLGIVNVPIGYTVGTRTITGSVNAYLRTGTTNTAGLLTAIQAAGVESKFRLQLEIGGASNATRVEVDLQAAMLQIPTIDAQAVMSTAINFTAQGTNNVISANTYDIEQANELTIRYFSV